MLPLDPLHQQDRQAPAWKAVLQQRNVHAPSAQRNPWLDSLSIVQACRLRQQYQKAKMLASLSPAEAQPLLFRIGGWGHLSAGQHLHACQRFLQPQILVVLGVLADLVCLAVCRHGTAGAHHPGAGQPCLCSASREGQGEALPGPGWGMLCWRG
jgi:hypothetical protein